MNRPRALQLYITCLACAALVVLAVCSVQIMEMQDTEFLHWLPYSVLFIALGWFCATQHLYVTDSNTVTMSTVAQIAPLLILPLSLALVVIALGKGLSMLYVRRKKGRSWRSTVLNTSSSVLANAAGGAALYSMHGPALVWSGQALQTVLGLPALVALAVVYHVTDTAVLTGALTLNSGESPGSVYRQVSDETLLPELSLLAVGIVFAILLHYSPVLSVFIVVPVYLSMRSFGAVARLEKETVEAVLKMAESIDYRDTGTYEHSERLANLCGRLAREIGLTPEHVRETVLASRVHDLGKIGISNDILLKQGPLTLQERQIMEEHPMIGATILESYSSFRESVDIVRHHHERWDGKGYPDGLKGEAIPIGSRIITVVDAFDAMTSDRPYRRGMSVEEAVERLKSGMGSQFDPRTCACFIQVLIEQGTFVPSDQAVTLHLVGQEAG
jgi:putative nucleotidyltransferase with HDIG domain